MKYSIVVSIYNIQDYIKECVDSILKQTVKDFELLLVDDGSTDGSGKICESYAKIDNRVTVLHKQNGGLSDARNAGLSASKGEYVYFVDGDDWLEPNTLEEFDTLLKEYGNVDFIHGRYTVYYTQTGKYELFQIILTTAGLSGKRVKKPLLKHIIGTCPSQWELEAFIIEIFLSQIICFLLKDFMERMRNGLHDCFIQQINYAVIRGGVHL